MLKLTHDQMLLHFIATDLASCKLTSSPLLIIFALYMHTKYI